MGKERIGLSPPASPSFSPPPPTVSCQDPGHKGQPVPGCSPGRVRGLGESPVKGGGHIVGMSECWGWLELLLTPGVLTDFTPSYT